MISEYVIEDSRCFNALRAMGLALGAVVIVAALAVALIQKARPW